MKSDRRKPGIIPHIWFEDQALEAAKLYVGLFPDSQMMSEISLDGTPSGSVIVLNLRLADQPFRFLNAGPYSERNPSVSYMVACDSEAEIDRLWQGLAEGAEILMPIDAYDFSGRYGWLKDRYGVSWQLMLSTEPEIQKITPSFLFVNSAFGKAEKAMNRFMSLFPDSGPVGPPAYHSGDDPQGGGKTLDYARFFNEMQSLIVECGDQKELDYYWNALTHDKSAEQCGWLKDEFGLSWQIVPVAMERMMREGNKAQLAAVTDAFLKMKKFDIAALEEAYACNSSPR